MGEDEGTIEGYKEFKLDKRYRVLKNEYMLNKDMLNKDSLIDNNQAVFYSQKPETRNQESKLKVRNL